MLTSNPHWLCRLSDGVGCQHPGRLWIRPVSVSDDERWINCQQSGVCGLQLQPTVSRRAWQPHGVVNE